MQYEDDVLQAQAVSVLPDHILALIGQKGEKEDELAKHLLAFFKNDFFTWVSLSHLWSLPLFPLDYIRFLFRRKYKGSRHAL